MKGLINTFSFLDLPVFSNSHFSLDKGDWDKSAHGTETTKYLLMISIRTQAVLHMTKDEERTEKVKALQAYSAPESDRRMGGRAGGHEWSSRAIFNCNPAPCWDRKTRAHWTLNMESHNSGHFRCGSCLVQQLTPNTTPNFEFNHNRFWFQGKRTQPHTVHSLHQGQR